MIARVKGQQCQTRHGPSDKERLQFSAKEDCISFYYSSKKHCMHRTLLTRRSALVSKVGVPYE